MTYALYSQMTTKTPPFSTNALGHKSTLDIKDSQVTEEEIHDVQRGVMRKVEISKKAKRYRFHC